MKPTDLEGRAVRDDRRGEWAVVDRVYPRGETVGDRQIALEYPDETVTVHLIQVFLEIEHERLSFCGDAPAAGD
jgi:hypothetical protein